MLDDDWCVASTHQRSQASQLIRHTRASQAHKYMLSSAHTLAFLHESSPPSVRAFQRTLRASAYTRALDPVHRLPPGVAAALLLVAGVAAVAVAGCHRLVFRPAGAVRSHPHAQGDAHLQPTDVHAFLSQGGSRRNRGWPGHRHPETATLRTRATPAFYLIPYPRSELTTSDPRAS